MRTQTWIAPEKRGGSRRCVPDSDRWYDHRHRRRSSRCGLERDRWCACNRSTHGSSSDAASADSGLTLGTGWSGRLGRWGGEEGRWWHGWRPGTGGISGGTASCCGTKVGWKSSPAEACGDGINNQNGIEECDDGNVLPGDGCNGACRVEKNWTCPSAGNVSGTSSVATQNWPGRGLRRRQHTRW